jgi:hypothetical protein
MTMQLSIKKAGSKGPGTSDTVGTSAGVASAGKVPHLGSTGLLSGTMTMVYTNAGVPVDGTTGDNIAAKGSLLIDTTNANLYVQTGLITNPVWKLVTRAA